MNERIAEVRSWVEENDSKLYRSAPFELQELRDSGNGIPGSYAIKGTASVYNKWSLNLGGFRERILPGAFDRVLGEDPHVLHTWDHDTSKALSSTRSKQFPLELSPLERALGFYSRVAPTSYSQDLRILMEGDVINQSSFAFTVREAEWRFIEDEDILERDIGEVDGLFDVTTCAMGAYPQTESEIAVRSLLQATKRTSVFIPTSVTTTTSFDTRSSGVEGNAEPAADPAPVLPEAVPAAEPVAPDEDENPPATPEPSEQPEDLEAKEREFKAWQKKRAAEHRRTREFAYGVPNHKEEK